MKIPPWLFTPVVGMVIIPAAMRWYNTYQFEKNHHVEPGASVYEGQKTPGPLNQVAPPAPERPHVVESPPITRTVPPPPPTAEQVERERQSQDALLKHMENQRRRDAETFKTDQQTDHMRKSEIARDDSRKAGNAGNYPKQADKINESNTYRRKAPY